jgi:hypothetical protein
VTHRHIPGDQVLNPTAVQRSKLGQLVIFCGNMCVKKNRALAATTMLDIRDSNP